MTTLRKRTSSTLATTLLATCLWGCGEDKETIVYRCPVDGAPAPTAKLDAAAPSPDAASTAADAAAGSRDVATAAPEVGSGSDARAADRPPTATVDASTVDAYARPTYDALPNMGMKATGLYVYASGYLPSGVNHDDMYIFQLNPTDGKLDLRGRTPGLGANPSFAIAYDKRFLYVAAEGASRLNALKIEDHGGLTPINWVTSQGKVAAVPAYPTNRLTRFSASTMMTLNAAGANPVYVRVHRSGKWILTANYYGDVSVYPRNSDGSVGEATVYYTGRNTHSVNIHPTKNIVYVTNTAHTGAFENSVSIFNLDETTGVLTPHATQPRFVERPFLLVRHTAFHPSGDYLYGIGEASDTVAVFKVAADGALSAVKEYPSLPMGVEDPLNRITGAEIVFANDVIYASLRGSARDNTKTWIVSHRVDKADPSKLTLLEHNETRGDHARGFFVEPGGKFLIVANQWTSDVPNERTLPGNLSTFAIEADGKLRYLATTSPGDIAPATVVALPF
jgi:6-phosphogluconolactonase (cycloisomerase 2 family)